jgi:hypothetical protein
MAENQGTKLTPLGQAILIAGVVGGAVIATAVGKQLGFTGVLWSGLFGALGGGLGAAIGVLIAGMLRPKS